MELQTLFYLVAFRMTDYITAHTEVLPRNIATFNHKRGGQTILTTQCKTVLLRHKDANVNQCALASSFDSRLIEGKVKWVAQSTLLT